MAVTAPHPGAPAHSDAIEEALYALQDRYPTAPMAAVDATGLILAMPDSVRLLDNPVVRGRSGLDGVPAEDRAQFITTFDRVLSEGMAQCPLHTAGYGGVVYHGFDLRERHGVLIGILTPADNAVGDNEPASPEPSPAEPPRVATVKKSERSFIIEVGGAITEILGWSEEELVGQRSLELVHPDDHALAIDNWMEMLFHPGPGRRVRQRLRHRDGSWVWFEVTNHNLLGDPDQRCVVCEMVDISDEMAAHEALRAREQLLDRLAETVPVGLLQTDAEGQVVYTNERLHTILGVDRAATAEAQLATVIESDRTPLWAALEEVLGSGSDADIEVAIRRSEHEALRFCTINLRALRHEDGSVSGVIACVIDTTESTLMREELSFRATYDDLTGCYNRASIMDALEADVRRGRQAERAVMFIDLDGFKAINDGHGHAAGDRLLSTVARLLRESTRAGDLVGRTGGDEFLVLCPDVGGAERAVKLAARIARALRRGLSASGDDAACQVSIGVAWSRGKVRSADELVATADEAMYESKRDGNGEPKLLRRRRTPPRPRSARPSADATPAACSPTVAA